MTTIKTLLLRKKRSLFFISCGQYKITSPLEGISYEINEILTSNNIEVKKTITTTERYKLRKIVNGVETNPAEYQNNGTIYNGQVSTTSYTLDESAYKISLTQL